MLGKIRKYRELKARGLVTHTRNGDRVFFDRRRFDADTGLEVQPERTELSVAVLREIRAAMATDLSAVEAILADLELEL